MIRRAFFLAAAAATLVAAAPAAGHDGPSVISEAGVVRPGDRYVIDGEGWFVGPRCESRVTISRRERHGFRVGSAHVRDNGTFSFSHRVPRSAPRGARIVLDVTQLCDGIGTSRTVRIRVGKARRTCPGPLSVDGHAYLLKVFGGLSCADGSDAVGPFIDTAIDPLEWDCAHVDRAIAGHDYACVEIGRPGRRVTARLVREV